VALAAETLPAGAGAEPARIGAALAGAGHAVPDTVVGNDAIARRLGVDEAWIESRTGTRERHVLAEGERVADLAARAAEAAVRDAGVAPGDIDLVLVGTTSADDMSPHAAPLVAGALGIHGAAAIDLGAACTGFLSGLALGGAMIETGRARVALVIGADGLTIGAVARELGADPARVLDVVGRFANTSAASIPIALSVAAAEGRLTAGDTVLLAAFGAGLVWGGTVATWRPGSGASAAHSRP